MRHDPKSQPRRFITHRCGQRLEDDGQVSILVVLAVGLFLIMFAGFGVDMTNLFLHRQMAQNAADAACVAAGMDIFVNRTKGPSGADGCSDSTNVQYNCGGLNFIPGATPISCNARSSLGNMPASSGNVAACVYAAINGYSSPSSAIPGPGVESNFVQVSFPPTIPGVTTPPATIAGAFPFVQVDVYDGVRVYFSSWLGASNTQVVHALAKCGLQNETQPVPIIVLDPTCPHAFEVTGSATVAVEGGPSKSIQVNSGNKTCAAATDSGQGQCGGNGTVDLSMGGPNLTGSNFGVFGAPGTAPKRFMGGTTGSWVNNVPVADPWALLVPPTRPAQVDGAVTVAPDPVAPGSCKANTNPCPVDYLSNGCPDHSGCMEYGPGWYAHSVKVKGFTAIFDPGIYYMTGVDDSEVGGTPGTGCINKNGKGQSNYGLAVDSNGVVRPSAAGGDGSGGTLFYFSSTSGKAGTWPSVFFGSNAGNSGGRTIDNAPGSLANCPKFVCPKNTTCPTLPSGFPGNVLVGPCTGTYSVTDASGNNYHGMLMWDDRANGDPNGQPQMQGGGGLALAGNLYFHNCPASPNCQLPPTDYNAFFNLQGTPGSSTFVFGDITTDELVEGGNSTIQLVLNTNLIINILKVELLQ